MHSSTLQFLTKSSNWFHRDTVSSIGVVRGKRLLPGTTDGMRHVCFFRHALALDERRVKFLPEYAYGGSGLQAENPGDNAKSGDIGDKSVNRQNAMAATGLSYEGGPVNEKADVPKEGKYAQIKEVWFAGTHSDM